MYTDDICLVAPSAIGLQKMLDLCFDFSLIIIILINSLLQTNVPILVKK